MRKPFVLVVLTLGLFAISSRSWAGTCPDTANYLNTTNPAGPHVTLATLGVTNCFYIAANGSDANSGADEAHPWLHAPGMSSCKGNCASNSPTGGTGYIFRGGDTWHMGNSGLTPYTNGWTWAWSGTSQSVPIYIGVDPSWYSGGSWARPVLTADNPTRACPGKGPCPVASCAYASIGSNNTMLEVPGQKWVVLDNFELTGYCWNNSQDQDMMGYYSSSSQNVYTPYYLVIEDSYLHGWTHTSSGPQGTASALEGNASLPGVVIQFNVVDGQDSDDLSMSILGANNSDLYIVRYNVFRHSAGDIISSSCHYIHDNLWEYYNMPTDGSGHGDYPFCEGEYAGGSGAPNLFFNNTWRYVGTTYDNSISYVPDLATPLGQTDYVFNNVWHDNQPTASGDYLSDEGRSGNWLLFNNTVEMIPNGATHFVFATLSAVTSVNNHWISSAATQASIFAGAPASETAAIYMTNSSASAQGYTSANDFAPTSASNSTVTAAGVNETTKYCADSVLHYAIAEAACVAGTTNGCSYNTSNHTVSCPAIAANSRPPSGAWNVGAYQYGTVVATRPAPPTKLVVTVH